MEVHRDGYKDLMEEDGSYGASGVLFDGVMWYLWCVRCDVGSFVWRFLEVVVVLVRWMGYLHGSKCESRCLFSCLHLDRISDILFRRVFCDGWMIIASFLWWQKRHFFMSCSWQVLVLVFPQWWWVRCSCLWGARKSCTQS